MRRDRPSCLVVFAIFAVSVTLLGCSSVGPTVAPSSPSPVPATPTPSVAPSPSTSPIALGVTPTEPVGKLFSGSPYVLLVTVSGSPAEGPVKLAAHAKGATVTVSPAELSPGTVGEVTVVPDPVTEEKAVTVAVTAERGEGAAVVGRTLMVTPEVDQLGQEAALHLTPFVSWLAKNRPDLGISEATEWQGMPGAWVLVVSHYQYVSKDWEAGLAWHVMLPPDDWATLYLRHRWTEATPSLAFRISSVSGNVAPMEEAPPESVWR